MMSWFDTLFAPVMILSPLIFTLCIRTRPGRDPNDTGRPMRIRVLSRRLLVWTATALGALALLRTAGGEFAVVMASYLWFVFFPLWFGAAMPLLGEKDVGWRPQHLAGIDRSASLVRRVSARRRFVALAQPSAAGGRRGD